MPGRIRVETIDYFLKRYRESLIGKKRAHERVGRHLATYERRLREDPAGWAKDDWKTSALVSPGVNPLTDLAVDDPSRCS